MSAGVVSFANARRESGDKDVRRRQAACVELWVVLDEDGRPGYTASWPGACHEHIADAIQEHDIAEARHWVVRRAVIQHPRGSGQ